MLDKLSSQADAEVFTTFQQNEATPVKKVWTHPEIIEIKIKAGSGSVDDGAFGLQS